MVTLAYLYRSVSRKPMTINCCTSSGVFMVKSLWPVTPYDNIELRQEWLRLWLVCLTTPCYYINQCWFPVKEVLCYSPESNFGSITRAAIRNNELEKYSFKSTAKSPRVSELSSDRRTFQLTFVGQNFIITKSTKRVTNDMIIKRISYCWQTSPNDIKISATV